MKKVFIISPLGEITCLVDKKNNLQAMGKSRTTRYSSILYTSDSIPKLEHLNGDQVVIRIDKGFNAGYLLTTELYEAVVGEKADYHSTVKDYYPINHEAGNTVMLFNHYDKAVEFEIKFFNATVTKGLQKNLVI